MPKRHRSRSRDRDDWKRFQKKVEKYQRKLDKKLNKKRRRERSNSSSHETDKESNRVEDLMRGAEGNQTTSTPTIPTDGLISGNTTPTNVRIEILSQKEQEPGETLPEESNVNKNTSDVLQSQTKKDAPIIDLDNDIIEILGDDPTTEIKYGPEIHKEIASRFENIATLGLSKENRKEITEKYLTPANCTRIGAPLLNPEIKAAVSEAVIKRDKGIESKQRQLATAIASLGKAISAQLSAETKDTEMLKDLMNTGRMLCDLQHAESITRRNFTMYSLKKEIKDQLTESKIDKYLFGENLAETLKAAKAVSKSSTDIKFDSAITPKINKKVTKPLSFKNLNWKAPVSPRRQQGPQRSQETASQRNQHNNSSKRSQNQPKYSYRR